MYGGDPFYEYRRAGILPEKYEFGMNCLFDTICRIHGFSYAQTIYEELRKDEKGYNIVPDTNRENYPGIPVLFGVKFMAPFTAQKAILNRAKQEISKFFFYDLSLVVKSTLDANRNAINDDRRIILSRIHFKNFVEHSDKLLNTIIYFKEKDKEYYDFIAFQGLKNGYAHDAVNGRPVALLQSSIDDILVMLSKAVKNKYFMDAKEISIKEAKNISIVKEYYYYDQEGKPVYKPVYREGDKIYILEDGYNFRVITKTEEESKRVNIIIQSRKDIIETISMLRKCIPNIEESVRKAEFSFDSATLDKTEASLNSINETLSKLKNTDNNIMILESTLSKKMLAIAADASGKLETENIPTQLREMELRLRNISQTISFTRKKGSGP